MKNSAIISTQEEKKSEWNQTSKYNTSSRSLVAPDRHQRRRQIDPTTCERNYTNDEIEFMNALDEYKRSNGRMFPTCCEILEVLISLGYVKEECWEQPL